MLPSGPAVKFKLQGPVGLGVTVPGPSRSQCSQAGPGRYTSASESLPALAAATRWRGPGPPLGPRRHLVRPDPDPVHQIPCLGQEVVSPSAEESRAE